MKILICLFLTTNLYALSPPPINFEHEEVKLEDGRTFVVEFKNGEVTIEQKKDDEPPEEPPIQWLGCFVFFGALFWISAILFFLWKIGWLTEVLIGGLIVGLVIHVYFTFRRKK